MMRAREIEFKVGRRSVDGVVKLSDYPPKLLQLSVSYKGERASSVVLTRSQVQALQQALAQFELGMDPEESQQPVWDQHERRVV
jgi:hypothetical protein